MKNSNIQILHIILMTISSQWSSGLRQLFSLFYHIMSANDALRIYYNTQYQICMEYYKPIQSVHTCEDTYYPSFIIESLEK